jgi:hypothetical protein
MANEPMALARSPQARAPVTDDYEAFSEVLAASARGRAFLAEHARRSRTADTELLLAALVRIEALVRANTAAQAEPAQAELRTLLMTVRSARPEIEASQLPTRAAKLAVLLDLLEERITALAVPTAMLAFDATAETASARLAVVPPPEEPELPIPSPAALQPPPLVLAPAPATPQPEAGKSTPEVTWFDSPPPGAAGFDDADEGPSAALSPTMAEKVAALSEPMPKAPTAAMPPDEANIWELSNAKLAPLPSDPLAAIMMLTEEERIALFT